MAKWPENLERFQAVHGGQIIGSTRFQCSQRMAGHENRSGKQADILQEKLTRCNRNGRETEAGFNHARCRQHEAQGREKQSGRQRTPDQ